MGSLAALPIHKKIPKELTDFTNIIQPPQGFGANAMQPTPGPTDVQFSPELMSQGPPAPMGAPTPLTGAAGVGPMAAGAPHGMSLPTPGAGLAPPQYRMNPQDTGNSLGFGPMAGAAPPAYSPIYSPEELTQQAAQRTGATAQATIQAQIATREKLLQEHPDWNFQQIELAMGQKPESMYLGGTIALKGPKGEKIPAFRGRYDTNIYDKDGNIIQNPQLWTSADEADTVWKATLQAHQGNIEAALKDYNTTQSQRTGYMYQKQADGSVQAIPFEAGTTTTRGGGAPPEPPVSKITGAGTTVGRTVPEPVQKAFGVVNDAESRYETMTESLPRALAGDQQAMVNLLGAHIGMTVQGNSIRGTQSVWNEAAGSTPWLEKALARWTNIDPDTGDVTITLDPKAGVFLTPPQMKSMLELAKQRVATADKAYDRVREETRKGYGMNKETPPPPGGTVKMQAPAGPDGKPGPIKPVPADQVEHFKSLGATVVQ
jgi:hypothetical protein